jgi:hypothetical protein
MTFDGIALDSLIRRAQAEYLEMPGLCLTCQQAQRLWGLDASRCGTVLKALTGSGFLVETRGRQYVLAGSPHTDLRVRTTV